MDVKPSKINKTVFITLSLSGGGAEAVCVNVANALANKNHDITILVLNENKSVYHTEINENVKYEVLGVSNIRYSFFSILKWIFINKPRKIVAFNYELSILIIILRFFFLNRFTVFSRNINNIEKKYSGRGIKGFFIKKMVLFFLGKSDFIINQCFLMQQQFISFFPDSKKKSSVIYNPLNERFNFKYSDISSFHENNINPYFLCVGRLSHQKSFSFALESFSIFLKCFPNYKLLIIGEGELESKLKRQVIDLNIDRSVVFKGFSRELSKYYANATAVLLTSQFEGFPNVLVESIAHATPIISLDCKSGPSEIVEDGVNGYIVRNRSPIDFSNKMIDLVVLKKFDPFLIYKSSRRFSVNEIVLNWEEVLKK